MKNDPNKPPLDREELIWAKDYAPGVVYLLRLFALRLQKLFREKKELSYEARKKLVFEMEVEFTKSVQEVADVGSLSSLSEMASLERAGTLKEAPEAK